MYSFEQIRQIIESGIEQIKFDRRPQSLYLPVHYILSLGGKRIRPVLMLMACNLFSDEVENALKPALGMEIFHNFSLLHDDLMDNANIRRNRPTVHEKWSPNTAILSGDAMLILAYQLIGDTTPSLLKSILDIFTRTALEICEGQQYDMDFEQRLEVTEEEYMEMIRLKTAVLLACCIQSGALIGGATPAEANQLYQFGIYAGLAFQLQDDLLDTFGDPHTFGKNIGGDILCNKKTFLHIQAMKLASDLQKERIHLLRSDRNCCPEEKIKAIKSIYESLGIRELTEDRIRHYYSMALNELDGLHLPVERLQMFFGAIDLLLGRKS
ncbi:MAG: polyprenyl synthetase family protein [Tannerella sp.]|jgi:geranylgeranyl diphosphate synthase type II|nr:polyprenyl synthetase family protein [Tannerella sp.]